MTRYATADDEFARSLFLRRAIQAVAATLIFFAGANGGAAEALKPGATVADGKAAFVAAYRHEPGAGDKPIVETLVWHAFDPSKNIADQAGVTLALPDRNAPLRVEYECDGENTLAGGCDPAATRFAVFAIAPGDYLLTQFRSPSLKGRNTIGGGLVRSHPDKNCYFTFALRAGETVYAGTMASLGGVAERTVGNRPVFVMENPLTRLDERVDALRFLQNRHPSLSAGLATRLAERRDAAGDAC